VLSVYKQRHNSFTANIAKHHYYEIIKLPDKEDFLTKKNSLKTNDFFSELNFNYSISDFCEHLKHNIQLLKTYDNYQLLTIDDFPYHNIRLAVKDEVGAVITRNDEKTIIIAFNQPNITNSFYTYLNYVIKEIPKREKNKKQLIDKLNDYLEALSEQ